MSGLNNRVTLGVYASLFRSAVSNQREIGFYDLTSFAFKLTNRLRSGLAVPILDFSRSYITGHLQIAAIISLSPLYGLVRLCFGSTKFLIEFSYALAKIKLVRWLD